MQTNLLVNCAQERKSRTRKVVVIDFHKLMRDVLSIGLGHNGDEIQVVSSAKSIKEIYSIFEEVEIDIVILDVKEMNLIPKIKNFSPRTRVIVLSANKNDAQYLEALYFGADRYLSKEIEFEKLKQAVLE